MKIELYHLYKHFHFSSFAYPVVLDVLKVWAESIGWQAQVLICGEDKVDLSTDADVVGISVYTHTAPMAYRLSDELRRTGKVVILGGPHFRGPATCEEGSSHCDVLVASTNEEQWKGLLSKIDRGAILPAHQKTLYIVDEARSFRYPDHFYESLNGLKWYQVPSVPTSIGCPYDCSFCSPYMQGDYILRDIGTIYREVAHTKGKIVFLCDATFGLNRRFTIDLMRALAPLGKSIAVETTLSRLGDREVLSYMALGGIKWIIVGIETPSMKMKKHGATDSEESLRRIVDYVHGCGMFIQGNLICGLDCDGPESFEQMHQLCHSSDLDSIMVDILTPYPNTELYDRLKIQGRIIDTNWEHYDYHHVVYRPLRMTTGQLIDGYLQLYRSLTNTGHILRDVLRICRDNGINRASAVVAANRFYYKQDAIRKGRILRSGKRQSQREADLSGTNQG